MARTLIQGATVVTLNAGDEILTPGDVVVDGDRLAYVGPPEAARRAERYDRVLDGTRRVVLPGLVNAHAHTSETLFGGTWEGLPLDIWRLRMRAPVQQLDGEALELCTLLACAQMLRTGVTTVLDHYFANARLPYAGMEHEVRALQRSGIRAAVAYLLADLPWESTLPLNAAELAAAQASADWVTAQETGHTLDAYEEFLAAFGGRGPRLTCLVGPSAVHRLSDGMFEGCAALAERYDVGLHLHVGETKAHAVQCRQRWGTTLVGRLQALGVLGPRVSMAHGVWLDDAELRAVAAAGATIVHNPASNLKLGNGVARVRAMQRLGVRVALGTDGSCSNDNQNLWESMRLAALLQTSNRVDYAEWPTARQVLRMATRHGAHACYLADEVGALEAGKRADVVMLTRDSYHLAADNNLPVQLVYCENGTSVETVLVDGEIVVEDGRLTTVDEPALYREVGRLRESLRGHYEDEIARAATLDPPLRAMYLRLAGEPLAVPPPAALFE